MENYKMSNYKTRLQDVTSDEDKMKLLEYLFDAEKLSEIILNEDLILIIINGEYELSQKYFVKHLLSLISVNIYLLADLGYKEHAFKDHEYFEYFKNDAKVIFNIIMRIFEHRKRYEEAKKDVDNGIEYMEVNYTQKEVNQVLMRKCKDEMKLCDSILITCSELLKKAGERLFEKINKEVEICSKEAEIFLLSTP